VQGGSREVTLKQEEDSNRSEAGGEGQGHRRQAKQFEELRRKSEQGSRHLHGKVHDWNLTILWRQRFPETVRTCPPWVGAGVDLLRRSLGWCIGLRDNSSGHLNAPSRGRTTGYPKYGENHAMLRASLSVSISTALP